MIFFISFWLKVTIIDLFLIKFNHFSIRKLKKMNFMSNEKSKKLIKRLKNWLFQSFLLNANKFYLFSISFDQFQTFWNNSEPLESISLRQLGFGWPIGIEKVNQKTIQIWFQTIFRPLSIQSPKLITLPLFFILPFSWTKLISAKKWIVRVRSSNVHCYVIWYLCNS